MTINAAEYRSAVGLDSLYGAEVTQDDASAYLAGTPFWLAPAATVKAAPKVNSKTQYADDMAFDAMVSQGETEMDLEVTDVPAEVLARLTGATFDAASGRVFDNMGTPPYFALGFRSMKSDGTYRYYWYQKGRFAPADEEFATKTDTPEPKTKKLKYTAVKTVHAFDLGSINDGVKRIYGDASTVNFSATGWFSQVQTPDVVTPSALALSSSVPADGGTNVVVSSNITLTYNNALDANAVYNVSLLDASNEVVAAAVTIDAAGKVITINPDASLSAGAAYTVVSTQTDIYGQHLRSTVEFTTAA